MKGLIKMRDQIKIPHVRRHRERERAQNIGDYHSRIQKEQARVTFVGAKKVAWPLIPCA